MNRSQGWIITLHQAPGGASAAFWSVGEGRGGGVKGGRVHVLTSPTGWEVAAKSFEQEGH